MSIRGAKFAARVGDLCDNKPFSDWFRGYSEDVLASSCSRKGWLPELFVSQRKKTTKGSNFIPTRSGLNMFGRKGGTEDGTI